MAIRQTAKSAIRKAGLFYFVWVMFSYCTGGPFGLEDMVTTSGPGMTLIYLLIIPFFWSIPVSLVSAELTTAMPVEGGFYRWARAAFGDFWGFLAGWWNWCASFLLGGGLRRSVLRLSGFLLAADHVDGNTTSISLLVVALITWINVRGIETVGKVRHRAGDLHPAAGAGHGRDRPGQVASQSVCAGSPAASATVQRLRRGPGAGTVALLRIRAAFHRGRRSRESAAHLSAALAMVVPLSIAVYFLPTLASLAALGNWQGWHTGYFSDAAQLIGGPWLGSWMTLAAMVTNVSLLNGTVLTSTRMPFAMAEDGYLPDAADRQTSALRHALDRDHRLGVDLRTAGRAFAAQLITIYIWLRVGDHRPHCALGLATAAQNARHAAFLRGSRGKLD